MREKRTFKHFCFILLVILLTTGNKVFGQQEIQFTQYMFNGLAINPAYAGSHDVMNITLAHRNQWIGFNEAPSTNMLALHTPLNNDRVGFGVIINNDRINIHRNIRLLTNYSYSIPVGAGKLSMGILAGVINQRAEFTTVFTQNPNDPNFQADYNAWLPEFGAGFYYYTSNFYVGLSIPKITGNLFSSQGVQNERHLFLHLGRNFQVNESIQLNPSILLKGVDGASPSLDLNANMIFNEVLWTGLSLRNFNTINALIQVQLTQQFRVGYSYDTNFGDFANVTNGSHEIVLNLLLSFGRQKLVSPRPF